MPAHVADAVDSFGFLAFVARYVVNGLAEGAIDAGGFIWLVVRAWPPSSGRVAIAIGVVWLAMTAAFETFMGLVLMRLSLAQVFANYNLLAGRVWVLFLVWLVVAPWLLFRLRSAASDLTSNRAAATEK